ncbi:hypothetical protein I5Q34_14985 [Streptomyces sp. AV19]|uniref:hypothetical protein n=1 Tax=Streptomyces sp. AV19 TaxID=2793068 RepID=UPI0018FEAB51|nr:hypothetical protein [Streptomyces sp. AV19]MBH1935559.1 hypothetical protein [Streptomyces sp. AV19]MDG4534446.1 hypothetical protein [Streptomyces sp. AV19]
MSAGHRRFAAMALMVPLAAAAVGCGGDSGDKDDGGGSPGSSRPVADSEDSAPAGTLGELKGPDDVVVTISSAVRDGGGFVTVQGSVTNRGKAVFDALEWRSKETGLKSRSAISGASLVDDRSKKRYLVLRDTDGECLCTTGLTNIKPGESRPLFAQFPAPPSEITAVDFQLPTMPTVRIRLSG